MAPAEALRLKKSVYKVKQLQQLSPQRPIHVPSSSSWNNRRRLISTANRGDVAEKRSTQSAYDRLREQTSPPSPIKEEMDDVDSPLRRPLDEHAARLFFDDPFSDTRGSSDDDSSPVSIRVWVRVMCSHFNFKGVSSKLVLNITNEAPFSMNPCAALMKFTSARALWYSLRLRMI
jgi:hypothetical protein